MAKAAKEAPAQNKALEADILNEGAKAAGATPVNQQDVKEAAQNLGNAPVTGPINEAGQPMIGHQDTVAGTPGPGVQMPGSNLPPVNQSAKANQAMAEEWGDKERDAAIAAANAGKVAQSPTMSAQPFVVPQYLN